MLQRAIGRAALVARVPRLAATRTSAPRRALSSANGAVKGNGSDVKTLGGRQVRVCWWLLEGMHGVDLAPITVQRFTFTSFYGERLSVLMCVFISRRLPHQVRVKVSPEEVAQKQQDEMFKDVLLYRMVQKIPVKNQHLRTIIASLIFIGVIISPKLIGKAKKKGEGYLDMELPDDVVEAREKQGRQAQSK